MRAKAKIISDINFIGLVAVIRTEHPDQLIPLCEALVAGGAGVLELTMTIPDAPKALASVAKHFGQRAIVGMGSILNAKMAAAAIEAGAEFLVTPITKVEVVVPARTAGRAVMIGAYTPTEAQLAHDAGADYVKIFPADGLGPGYLKALRGPMPHLRLVPTGGVTVENVGDFLKAGAAALGVGSSLVSASLVKEANWAELTKRAAAFVQAVKQARAA